MNAEGTMSAKRKKPWSLLFCIWLTVPNVAVLLFREGESFAYYLGAKIAVAIGVFLLIRYAVKSRKSTLPSTHI
jgi:hypothetical protein